jgi:hypothetical protein
MLKRWLRKLVHRRMTRPWVPRLANRFPSWYPRYYSHRWYFWAKILDRLDPINIVEDSVKPGTDSFVTQYDGMELWP